MKKRIQCTALLLTLVALAATPACGLLEESAFLGSSYEETDGNGGSSSAVNGGADGSANSGVSDGDANGGTSDETPDLTPENPNPNKTVERYETDKIGHKIVYYTDGTYEDLGRVVPLNFASPAPQTQYGYQSLAKESKGKGMCGFYEDLYDLSTAFHNSTRNVTVEEDEYGEYCLLGDVNYKQYSLTDEEATAVWKVFVDENPIFYWMDITFYYGSGEMSCLVDPAYASYSVRKQANEAIQAMALECDSYLSGFMSQAEIAMTIYDYLIGEIDYAYEEDGYTVVEESWAYNVAGGATTGYGVCECYAETYSYFCKMFGIECLNVVGYAGDENDQRNWGGHAWNYLALDGKWYAVDATWGDQEQVLRDYFGQELSSYNATHAVDLPTSDWGIEYQCALPALSDGLCPVLYGEEGKATSFAASIDEAFEKMTNEEGRYEIILYPDSAVTKKNGMDIYPYGAYVFTTKALPKVAHITFTSENTRYTAELLTKSAVSLQCNVTMKGVSYTKKDWNKNGYTISQR